MHDENESWTWSEADDAEASAASTYSAPPMYSADYLRVTQPAPEPIVSVGFGKDGNAAYILRNRQGREVTRISADKSNAANERPRGFFHAIARLFVGGQR